MTAEAGCSECNRSLEVCVAHQATPPPGSTLSSESQFTMGQREARYESAQKNPAIEVDLDRQAAARISTHYYGDKCVPPHPDLERAQEDLTHPSVIPVDFDPKVAFKDDSKKTDLSLLPYRPLAEIAEVLEFGERKYERDNWRKGFPHQRLVAALLRHVLAYNDGETNDPETGLCHLAHAGCMLLFLMETRHTHPHLDYRPNATST